jgi:hypothetical protein
MRVQRSRARGRLLCWSLKPLLLGLGCIKCMLYNKMKVHMQQGVLLRWECGK